MLQRGYVRNRDQAQDLMATLCRNHPVSSLLFWATPTESATARDQAQILS